jgi:hypothetical protein
LVPQSGSPPSLAETVAPSTRVSVSPDHRLMIEIYNVLNRESLE